MERGKRSLVNVVPADHDVLDRHLRANVDEGVDLDAIADRDIVGDVGLPPTYTARRWWRSAGCGRCPTRWCSPIETPSSMRAVGWMPYCAMASRPGGLPLVRSAGDLPSCPPSIGTPPRSLPRTDAILRGDGRFRRRAPRRRSSSPGCGRHRSYCTPCRTESSPGGRCAGTWSAASRPTGRRRCQTR